MTFYENGVLALMNQGWPRNRQGYLDEERTKAMLMRRSNILGDEVVSHKIGSNGTSSMAIQFRRFEGDNDEYPISAEKGALVVEALTFFRTTPPDCYKFRIFDPRTDPERYPERYLRVVIYHALARQGGEYFGARLHKGRFIGVPEVLTDLKKLVNGNEGEVSLHSGGYFAGKPFAEGEDHVPLRRSAVLRNRQWCVSSLEETLCRVLEHVRFGEAVEIFRHIGTLGDRNYRLDVKSRKKNPMIELPYIASELRDRFAEVHYLPVVKAMAAVARKDEDMKKLLRVI